MNTQTKEQRKCLIEAAFDVLATWRDVEFKQQKEVFAEVENVLSDYQRTKHKGETFCVSDNDLAAYLYVCIARNFARLVYLGFVDRYAGAIKTQINLELALSILTDK